MKDKIKRNEKAIPINSELASAIFTRRNIETEGDLIIPREQMRKLLFEIY